MGRVDPLKEVEALRAHLDDAMEQDVGDAIAMANGLVRRSGKD